MPDNSRRGGGRQTPRRGVAIAAATAQMQPLAAPIRFERPKRIHPRRILPYIREGMERDTHSTTPRAMIQAAPHAAGSEIRIVRNTALTAPGAQQTASNVGEPSVAVNGDVVLYTGNWYAALSTDGGSTFSFLDPASTRQPHDPAGVTFCCDQVAHYIPQIDMFIWLLQYGPDTGDNIQRIGFAKTADAATGRWRFFDLTTAIAGAPGAFMDFPDVAVGTNHLYVTTNVFFPDQRVGSVVFRVALDGLAQGNPAAEAFLSTDLQSFRVAQNCGTTAYFAAHEDTSTLRVFSWPEADAQPTSAPVAVARWIGGNSGYISRTPDGRRWLDRADSRITGATLAGNELWFAWSVDRGSNHRPRPFIQIARIAVNNLAVLENVNIFDSDSATAYPALSTNARGEVGISYMIGGAVFPSHVVGIVSGDRQNVVVSSGGRGPLPDASNGRFQWGDYLSVRRLAPNSNLFAATGYTQLGSVDGGNLDATPRFVVFGRTADVNSTVTTTPGGGTGDGGTGTVIGGGGSPSTNSTGPITDVNALSTVNQQVAAAIKTACGIGSGPQPEALAQLLPPPLVELVTSPGQERWPVKTGTDDDVALVGKNIINGHDLGRGIVEATVDELARVPRPASMPNVSTIPPGFLKKRAEPAETTIWRIEATIFVLKLEKDGDYHLGLTGPGGKQMIAEIPTPTKTFLGNSPWLANIKEARQMVDDKLVSKLSPQDFVPVDGILVPRDSVSLDALRPQSLSFATPRSFVPEEGQEIAMPSFMTAIKPTKARITGVGFFDRVHGQTGVSLKNGIELHPVLKIEWL